MDPLASFGIEGDAEDPDADVLTDLEAGGEACSASAEDRPRRTQRSSRA